MAALAYDSKWPIGLTHDGGDPANRVHKPRADFKRPTATSDSAR
jgi:hypothetical protein